MRLLMRVLIGALVFAAVSAALFSPVLFSPGAGPAMACNDGLQELRTEEHRLRTEREAIEARLAAQNRLQRARAALAEKRAQAAR